MTKQLNMDKLKQINYAITQLLEQGNIDIVDTIFSVNYVAHSGDKTHSGHKFIKQFAKQVRTAIPNIKILNVELLTQTDNILTCQRTFSGMHKGDLKGIPASNKKVKWHEIVVSRFDKGKIIEEWVVSDLAFQLMLRQK